MSRKVSRASTARIRPGSCARAPLVAVRPRDGAAPARRRGGSGLTKVASCRCCRSRAAGLARRTAHVAPAGRARGACAFAAALVAFGRGLASGFASSAAFFLPRLFCCRSCSRVCCARASEARPARSPAGSSPTGRQEISGLSLALDGAADCARPTNIGVGSMVEGFRQTFTAWLDARLVAEIYFEAATPADARDIEAWRRRSPTLPQSFLSGAPRRASADGPSTSSA